MKEQKNSFLIIISYISVMTLHRHMFTCFVVCTILLGAESCKKSHPTDSRPLIDPSLIGVWFSTADGIGYEIATDGSTKGLGIDSSGKVRYATADDAASSLKLTILGADFGEINARVRYISAFQDTTITIVGDYSFSNNFSTLQLVIPDDPVSNTTRIMVFQKTTIGAVPSVSSVRSMTERSQRFTKNTEKSCLSVCLL